LITVRFKEAEIKKSDLTDEYLKSFVDDIDLSWGKSVAKSCQEAIDKLGPDDTIHTGLILNQAVKDNSDVGHFIYNSPDYRLDSVIQ